MVRVLTSIIALLLAGSAFAQAPGQFPSGAVFGNSTAGTTLGSVTTMTLMFDRAYCSTNGQILQRGASVWGCVTPNAGTVTSVATGTGLTGGTITATGTISLATIADQTLLGNTSGATAAPTAQNATAITTLCNTFSTAGLTKGCVAGSNGGGASVFLNGNGGWTTPGGGGTVTSVAAGTGITVSPSPIVGAGTVTLANPSATTIGGIQSTVGAANQWISTISTSGVPGLTRPDFSNLSGSLASTQTPAYTGDVTSSAGATVNTLANIPNATPMAGDLLATNIAVPGTPAAGKSFIYVDSTNKVLSVKTDVPTVSNTVVPSTAAANSFATAVSAAGVVTYTQPTLANISGFTSGATNQVTVYTGTNTIAGTANHTISTGEMIHGVSTSVVGTESFVNLTSGKITLTPPTGALGTVTLTLPIVPTTETLIGKATTDTLTNKTYDTAGTGNVLKINGNTVSSVSGNTAKVGLVSGSPVSLCAKFDASGNLIGVGSGGGCSLVTVYGTGTATHTFQTGVVSVRLIGCGAGGGGGSGAKQTSGSNASGGSGGGGGGCFDRTFKASDLGASVSVQVGTGGTGGTVPGVGPIIGNNGTAGSANTCVSSGASCSGTFYANAGAGGLGAGGQLTTNSGGGGGGCVFNSSAAVGGNGTGAAGGAACGGAAIGTAGGYGTTGTAATTVMLNGASGGGGGLGSAGFNGGAAFITAAGGGSGGGVLVANGSAGGVGGYVHGIQQGVNGAAGGAATGTAGTSGTTLGSCLPGTPGGGGGGQHPTGGGTGGGNGGSGAGGSGGGGGGSTVSANTPGTGGPGGNGFLCVLEFM